MTDTLASIGRLLIAAVLLAIVGAGPSARAQQIDDDEEDEAPAQPMAGRLNGFVINDFQFDQWVFGNMGHGQRRRGPQQARLAPDAQRGRPRADLRADPGPEEEAPPGRPRRHQAVLRPDRRAEEEVRQGQELRLPGPVPADLAGDPAAAERVQLRASSAANRSTARRSGRPSTPSRRRGTRRWCTIGRSIDTGPAWTWRWSS